MTLLLLLTGRPVAPQLVTAFDLDDTVEVVGSSRQAIDADTGRVGEHGHTSSLADYFGE